MYKSRSYTVVRRCGYMILSPLFTIVINHVDAKKAIKKLGLLQGVDVFGVDAVSRSRRIEKEISKPSQKTNRCFSHVFWDISLFRIQVCQNKTSMIFSRHKI
jgi:hypothetical protein